MTSREDSSSDTSSLGEIRLDPIGASRDEEDDLSQKSEDDDDAETLHGKIKRFEEEQEILNSSIFALTTHFARVQLRLRQILNSPDEDRDEMLISLEDFATNGIPDVNLIREKRNRTDLVENVKECRRNQLRLVGKMKSLLDKLDTEVSALNFHAAKTSTSKEHGEKLNSETQVENTCPSEYFVQQLKTHVSDLENFIIFLKTRETCKPKNNFLEILRTLLLILEVFANIQLTFNKTRFTMKLSKRKVQQKEVVNLSVVPLPSQLHWGNLRAKFQMSLETLKGMISQRNLDQSRSIISEINGFARKDFASDLLQLMEHGLKTRPVNLFKLCFNRHLLYTGEEVIERFCRIRTSRAFLHPKFQLSQSFDLKINSTEKEEDERLLISTVENIMKNRKRCVGKTHSHFDFSEFVCAGLNGRKLGIWLELIYSCQEIVEFFYQPWSYAMQTNFQDCIESLAQLRRLKLILNLNMNDYNEAFT